MSRNSFRRHLSVPVMLAAVHACFQCVPDPLRTRSISLSDCLMSELAVFSFKVPSLSQFDTRVRGSEDPVRARNVRTLFRRGTGAIGRLDAGTP